LLDYTPGSALSEVDLAREFKVSRTPLRRVLQRLDYEGLVRIRNGIGTMVTDINLKVLKDTYDLRIRHALMVGELSSVPTSSADIRALDALIERMHTLKSKRDFKEYARNANAFHEIFLRLIGNQPLREITDLLYYRVARIWLTFLPNVDWPEEIRQMTAEFSDTRDAMLRADFLGIGRIRADHLRGILSRMSKYIAER
jgi:DNA-binding GntR family transcriptional regulator